MRYVILFLGLLWSLNTTAQISEPQYNIDLFYEAPQLVTLELPPNMLYVTKFQQDGSTLYEVDYPGGFYLLNDVQPTSDNVALLASTVVLDYCLNVSERVQVFNIMLLPEELEINIICAHGVYTVTAYWPTLHYIEDEVFDIGQPSAIRLLDPRQVRDLVYKVINSLYGS